MKNDLQQRSPSSFPWLPFFRSSQNLEDTLMRSHGSVAMVGLVLLIVSALSVTWLRTHTLRLTTETGPAVNHYHQLLHGLEDSVSALRGWIMLGQPRFRQEWEDAWNATIWPTFLTLQATTMKHAPPSLFQQLAVVLHDLEETQWYVQDVAPTPGNEPARAFLHRTVNPIGQSILGTITTLIEIEKNRPPHSEGGKLLVGRMADFRASFLTAQMALRAAIGEDPLEAIPRFTEAMTVLIQRLQSIQQGTAWLTPEERDLVMWLQDQLHSFHTLTNRVIELRRLPTHHVATHLSATQSLPVFDKARRVISELLATHLARFESEAETVTWGSSLTLWIAAFLFAFMMVAAVWLSHTHARRIAHPIARLSRATHHFAATHQPDPLPVTGHDEISQLTQAFNRMQHSLAESEEALQQAQEQLIRHSRLATLGQWNTYW